jgi:hypothetical protein
MQEMDALEEIKAMNMRHLQLLAKNNEQGFGLEAKAVLEAIAAKGQIRGDDELLNDNGLTEEDEILVKSIKFGNQPVEDILRLNQEDERKSEERRAHQAMMFEKQQEELNKKTASKATIMPTISVKRKRAGPEVQSAKMPNIAVEEKKDASSGLSLLIGYGSDSD